MSLQMSYYYGQPLVHCYLLHAEWLASEAGEHLDDAGKIRLQEKVIEASLKAAADAQGHLLSMQMPRSEGVAQGQSRTGQTRSRSRHRCSHPGPRRPEGQRRPQHERASAG
jgi:hypothetical protein